MLDSKPIDLGIVGKSWCTVLCRLGSNSSELSRSKSDAFSSLACVSRLRSDGSSNVGCKRADSFDKGSERADSFDRGIKSSQSTNVAFISEMGKVSGNMQKFDI